MTIAFLPTFLCHFLATLDGTIYLTDHGSQDLWNLTAAPGRKGVPITPRAPGCGARAAPGCFGLRWSPRTRVSAAPASLGEGDPGGVMGGGEVVRTLPPSFSISTPKFHLPDPSQSPQLLRGQFGGSRGEVGVLAGLGDD